LRGARVIRYFDLRGDPAERKPYNDGTEDAKDDQVNEEVQGVGDAAQEREREQFVQCDGAENDERKYAANARHQRAEV
jgi:hypothetical protein